MKDTNSNLRNKNFIVQEHTADTNQSDNYLSTKDYLTTTISFPKENKIKNSKILKTSLQKIDVKKNPLPLIKTVEQLELPNNPTISSDTNEYPIKSKRTVKFRKTSNNGPVDKISIKKNIPSKSTCISSKLNFDKLDAYINSIRPEDTLKNICMKLSYDKYCTESDNEAEIKSELTDNVKIKKEDPKKHILLSDYFNSYSHIKQFDWNKHENLIFEKHKEIELKNKLGKRKSNKDLTSLIQKAKNNLKESEQNIEANKFIKPCFFFNEPSILIKDLQRRILNGNYYNINIFSNKEKIEEFDLSENLEHYFRSKILFYDHVNFVDNKMKAAILK